MLKAFVFENVLKPAGRRLGTVIAAYMVVGGEWACTHLHACGLVTEAGADQAARYVIAVALLFGDLFWSYVERKKKKGGNA